MFMTPQTTPPKTNRRTAALPVLLLSIALTTGACGSDAQPVSADPPNDSTPTETSEPVDDTPVEGEQIPVEPDGGIGDTPLGQIPFFGANDDQCPSTVLANEESDQELIAAGATCFLDQVTAGDPVVWDMNQPTVEGDPIYTRHFYDGEAVWILTDTRADTYGSGTVDSQRCVGAQTTNWGIEGTNCAPAEFPSGFAGFPEAETN